MRLKNVINESIEKIKPEVILNDLINNKDLSVIHEFVSSKKKDDRIAIAANPNLTIEQMNKLASDKVNGVKQALCYNKSLTVDLARELLEEEPERLQFIAKYGGDQLDDLVLEFTNKLEKDWEKKKYIENLISSPSIKEQTIEKIINEYPDALTSSGARELYRNKSLSKKVVYMLVDHLQHIKSFTDNALGRLINNQTHLIKETDIKKMDWKNNTDIQSAVLYRADMSEKFVIDVIEHLNDDSKTSPLADNQSNPNSKSIKVLNALLKHYSQIAKISFMHEFNIFEKVKHLSLDPELLVKVAHKLIKTKDSTYAFYAKHLMGNVAFPDYGLDGIPANLETLPAILVNPNIDLKRAKKIIMNTTDDKEIDKIVFAFPANKVLAALDIETQKHIYKYSKAKTYVMRYVVNGEFADEVLDDLAEWSKDFLSGYGENEKPSKWKLILELSENKYLTASQKKRILSIKDDIIKEEDVKHGIESVEHNMLTTKHDDLEFMEELLKAKPSNIWQIWIKQSSTYFQYSEKIQKLIDKVALKTPNVPVEVLKGNSNRNFTQWFNYNNSKNPNAMSKETAFKYLLHFIKTGDGDTKKLFIDGFIDEEWLKNSDVMSDMYELTDDEKYLSDVIHDLFLF